MRKLTILVSAAGSTNGVNVIKALRNQNEYDVKIVAVDADADGAGLYLADEHEVVPRVSDPAFRDCIFSVFSKHNVDMIIPTHSVELPFYSSNQGLFNTMGIKIMVSPLEKLEVCDDKLKIARFLQRLGVKHPRIYHPVDLNSIPRGDFPLFIKSRSGSGSSHAHKVNNSEELSFYLGKVPDPIVQEYVQGTEYTVNIVSDYAGKVIGSLPLRRIKVRGGLAVVAETEVNQTLMEESRRVVEALGLVGASNVQAIARDGELIFLEVNPRFASGGLPLAVAAGLNIPLIMVKLMLGDPVPEPRLQDGKKMIRYWDFVIVD